MRLSHLWLNDFRNHEAVDLELPDGLTVVVGANGEGKTNLLEAIWYLTTLSSFRPAPQEALVRHGCERAFVRGQGEREGRDLLLEAEVRTTGRARVTLNRQPVRRLADLHDALRATVFAPDDLDMVKGGPAERRRYLDDLLAALHPRHDGQRRDLERILRQRTALLRDAGGRLTPEIAVTLDVWDAKLAAVGEAVADARSRLVHELTPLLAAAYGNLAGDHSPIGASYQAPWRAEGLATALVGARREELRRATCLVGPHRDELELSINAMPARTHASQGEQRCLALALRLGAHLLLRDRLGDTPLLLLDDVFSELDPERAQALVEHLPEGQAVLSTTGATPVGRDPALTVRLAGGRLMSSGRPPAVVPGMIGQA